MKNLWQLLACLAILVLCITVSSGQTKKKTNLKSLINQYAANTVRVLNKRDGNDPNFKYSVSNKNTFYADVNGDGVFDAIVEIFFCETVSCHATTNSSELIVFLSKSGNYRFAASKGFRLYGKINSIEDKVIYVDVYDLEEGDPQCCPEKKRSEAYFLKGNRLVQVPNNIY
jgi:hypothetical protein